MLYKFPFIQKLDDVLPYVKDMEEIAINYDGDYTSITYNVQMPDTFPDPTKASSTDEAIGYAMRRECRGIKFHPTSGDIIARPYHKFFNLNEKDETQSHWLNEIDMFSSKFHILDKADGSMLYPVKVDGKISLCTKRGITDISQDAMNWVLESDVSRGTRYMDFFDMMITQTGSTPIFEWVGRGNRIVVDYPETDLVLTGARFMDTGDYWTIGELELTSEPYNVPVITKWDGTFNGISEFCKTVKDNTGEEGYVIRFFDTGHMLKIKNMWYLKIHRAKDAIRFEKNVIGMVLRSELDDVLPEMEEADRDRINAFAKALLENTIATQDKIEDDIKQALSDFEATGEDIGGINKWFAINVANKQPSILQSVYHSVWQGRTNSWDALNQVLLRNLGSSAGVDKIRPIIGGIRWEDF